MALQINEKKLDRQLQGADRWKSAKDLGLSHNNGWGTFWFETGVGKTFLAFLICKKMLTKYNHYNIIIIVPSDALYKQWNQKLDEYIDKQYHQNFKIYTVHKLMQGINEGLRFQCSLAIFDELHEYYSEERRKMFNGQHIIMQYALGLTANYEDKDNRHKFIEHILPVVDRIDAEEATKEGFISEFIEYNLGVEFTEKERELYTEYTNVMTKNLSKFGKHGLELAGKVLRGDKEHEGIAFATGWAIHNGWSKDMDLSIESNKDIHAMWNPKVVIGYAANAMEAIRHRKDIIYCAMNKLRLARDVAIKFPTLKTMFFSQSTAFADRLSQIINQHYEALNQLKPIPCVVYHSNIPTQIYIDDKGKERKKGKTKLKREAVEAIRNGEAIRISTGSALDRGFDIEDILLIVTTSGTQNPTQYNQRNGRGKRYIDGKVLLVINFYVKGTIDESWLRKRQSKSKSVVYFVDKVDDINYTPKSKEMFNLLEI